MMTLTKDECRVLGVLVEKALTTPAQYPLTLNGTTLGCNQKNNRDPVTNFTEERVFDKFNRGNMEAAQSGVGLGLSICRAIVEAHGGRIAAENRTGGGALFRFSLPVTEPPPQVALDGDLKDAA